MLRRSAAGTVWLRTGPHDRRPPHAVLPPHHARLLVPRGVFISEVATVEELAGVGVDLAEFVDEDDQD